MDNSDIPFGRPWIDDVDRQAVMEVLRGHILTHGPKCKEFEKRFSEFVGGGYAVSTSSCMAALHLCSMHFKFGPGDEVIVPSQTHVATVHAVELVGARPVFVDSDLETGNIQVDQIESKITPKTKGLFVVHYAGIAADMDDICELAKEHRLKVIEDCALAVGAQCQGKHVGLWGDAGCFSFYPVKHMTTAEGGMLISKDERTIRDIAHFRAFSVDRSFGDRKIPGVYDVTGVGLNYRMSEMQAALGCTQVAKLRENLRIRKVNFSLLKKNLLESKHIFRVLDQVNPKATNSYYCLVVILTERLRKHRNEILLRLTKKGIGGSVYYPQPVPRMKYYNDKYKTNPKDYENAAIISDGSISLPVGPHVNESGIDRISETLKEILEGFR